MSPDRLPGPARADRERSRPLKRLLPRLAPDVTKALERYPEALKRALALRAGMEREIPAQIRSLSLALTADREGGPRPGYLSDPKILAAYAWYFLPWNLVRLSRLLPALDLDIPEGGLVCDLGAGPLTLVQALWLSRPDWRGKRLEFVCADRSKRALNLGLWLFSQLAGFDPTAQGAPWRVKLVRGEYWQGLAEGANLVAMVNVANEMAGSRREPLDVRMERLAGQLGDSLAPDGRLLLVEPGTRLGWRCLEGMRRSLREMGLGLVSPCPHARACPLAVGRGGAWCHFNMSLDGAPAWLTALSERAGLPKERLSLSFLLAKRGPVAPEKGLARVVSGAFSLPDVPGSAVYACSEVGLLVLVAPDRRPPRPGDLVPVTVPADAPRDRKTGAPRIVLPVSGAPETPTAPAGPRPSAKPPVRAARPDRGDRPARKTGPANPGSDHSGKRSRDNVRRPKKKA